MNLRINPPSNSVEALRDRFLIITSSPVDADSLNPAGEQIDVLVESQWTKTSIIRTISSKNIAEVEIEVSIPPEDGLENCKLLTSLITHLNYLRCLIALDFDLCMIREDCLWVASKSFSGMPDMRVFEGIIPPET